MVDADVMLLLDCKIDRADVELSALFRVGVVGGWYDGPDRERERDRDRLPLGISFDRFLIILFPLVPVVASVPSMMMVLFIQRKF